MSTRAKHKDRVSDRIIVISSLKKKIRTHLKSLMKLQTVSSFKCFLNNVSNLMGSLNFQ